MDKRRFIHLLLTMLLATGFVSLLMFTQSVARANLATRVIPAPAITAVNQTTSNQSGLQFTLTTVPFSVKENGAVQLAGLDNHIRQPGAPALPYYATYIALPPGADVIISVQETGATLSSVETLLPAPQPAAGANANALMPGGVAPAGDAFQYQPPAETYEPDPAIYNSNAIYPEAVYTLSQPMYWRDIRLVELRLYPLRYNPVTHVMRHARRLDVSITFEGAQMAGLRPSPTANDAYQRSLAGLVLNYEQARNWRSLPNSMLNATAAISLPTGVDTYKIELNQDGIYEISYSDLSAAGMNVGGVNPNTIEMMYRGQPVAYQFIGDADNAFESGEKIRFYGWAFDGPRTDKQFISNNVFWLWAGGAPTLINTTTNLAGTGLVTTTSTLATITEEPENDYFSTWTNNWDTFPNEPDAWYWDRITATTSLAPSYGNPYAIELPNPAPAGPGATCLVELFSRAASFSFYTVSATLNTSPCGSNVWLGRRNVNITNTVPITDLIDGTNNVSLELKATMTDYLYLNRITVAYQRLTKAVNDKLIFTDEVGSRQFSVQGFSEGNVSNLAVWNITDPAVPIQIDMAGAIAGSGPYTYTFGTNHPADSRFIATSILTNSAAISQYTPPSLNPANNRAEWLAISHSDFMAQANQLASHRASANYGAMETLVVDVEDVINQYGYGLPLPGAIRNYLTYAMGNWDVAPSYVALFGDATINPRNLNCGQSCAKIGWDKNAPTFVLADLPFVDRFQGLIPTDHTMTLLVGNDLLPDLAIGRLPAETAAEASAIVDKIILYEQNQYTPASWQQNILFVADNDDSGGSFCNENQNVGATLPASFNQFHLCLPGTEANPPTIADTDSLRTEMFTTINVTGTSILNYRGHGSIQYWASPEILSSSMTDFWLNVNKPIILLSADCLDGHFAWPGAPALSETYLKLDNLGTAVHWSSTGLGYTFEHTALHAGFYEGLFDLGLTAAGDAANYAKLYYNQLGYDDSELYAFTLQGDPAMQLFRPDLSLQKTAQQTEVMPGDTAEFTLAISNNGIYPAQTTITDTLPASLSYVSSNASVPVTTTVNGATITFELASALAWGDSATLTLTTTVNSGYTGSITNQATAGSPGLEMSAGDASDSALITSNIKIFMPLISNP